MPFEDQLFIQGSEKPTALEVVLYDLPGKAYPVAVPAVAGGVQLNALAPLPTGVYVLRIFTHQQIVKSLKVQKQ